MGEDRENPKEIKFVYEKARHHRTLHSDGVWAGLTPHAEIQFAFYNNLRRMPISVTHEVGENNALGPGAQEELSELVREVDVTVVMNIEVARATVELLKQMIAQADPIIARQAARQQQRDENSKVDTHG